MKRYFELLQVMKLRYLHFLES